MSLVHRARHILGPLACAGAALAAFPAAFSAAAEEPLGRLFLTPQQRQELDKRRQANVKEVQTPPAVESVVTLNGYVARSGGSGGTVWLNGVPQHGAPRTRDASRVRVPGHEGQPGVDLKVGQTLDKTRGEIRDGLDGGNVRVRPAPGAR